MDTWNKGDALAAVERSGMGPKEAVLFAGMLGSLETVPTLPAPLLCADRS